MAKKDSGSIAGHSQEDLEKLIYEGKPLPEGVVYDPYGTEQFRTVTPEEEAAAAGEAPKAEGEAEA